MMELTSGDQISPRKRVSFQDNTQLSFLRPDNNDNSNVEISELFPNMDSQLKKSILRNPGSSRRSMSPKSDGSRPSVGSRKKMPKRSSAIQDKEPRKRRQPLLPYKEPTESLAHALLRSMTHNEPIMKRKRPVVLPKLALNVSNMDTKHEDDRAMAPSQLSSSSRTGILPAISSRNSAMSRSLDQTLTLPEITSTPRDTSIVCLDRICGICRRNSVNHRARKPAAGFCKFCDEYLCAECVLNHRGKLTKLHPVVVFYCDICKEMNILNRRGSAYCIRCKHFYCSVDVVSHCAMTNHEVLEGKDLLDVTDVLIGK